MSSRRTLIIDPDHKSSEELRDLIAGWGYEVALAQDRAGAIARMNEFDPAVVISGSSSSDLDHFDLLREFRSLQPDTPVVLLTTDGSVETAVTAIQEEGAYYYLQKPVEPDKLRRVLELFF